MDLNTKGSKELNYVDVVYKGHFVIDKHLHFCDREVL